MAPAPGAPRAPMLETAQAQARSVPCAHDGETQPSIWHGLQHQIYVGEALFVTQMQAHITDAGTLDELPKVQRQRPHTSLDDFARASGERRAAMAAAYLSGTCTMQAIAHYFGVHYSTVSRAVRDAERGRTDA